MILIAAPLGATSVGGGPGVGCPLPPGGGQLTITIPFSESISAAGNQYPMLILFIIVLLHLSSAGSFFDMWVGDGEYLKADSVAPTRLQQVMQATTHQDAVLNRKFRHPCEGLVRVLAALSQCPEIYTLGSLLAESIGGVESMNDARACLNREYADLEKQHVDGARQFAAYAVGFEAAKIRLGGTAAKRGSTCAGVSWAHHMFGKDSHFHGLSDAHIAKSLSLRYKRVVCSGARILGLVRVSESLKCRADKEGNAQTIRALNTTGLVYAAVLRSARCGRGQALALGNVDHARRAAAFAAASHVHPAWVSRASADLISKTSLNTFLLSP